jgi:hypothetical protein
MGGSSRLMLLSIIALTLFIGGIFILLSPMKFWSLFLGIPSTQAGIVLLIMAFEKLTKDSLDEDDLGNIKLKSHQA